MLLMLGSDRFSLLSRFSFSRGPLWFFRILEGTKWMILVLSQVLYTPTSLSACSNMLFRRDMMMNWASFVRFLMYSATIDTFLKSKAASISSMKYNGVGLQQWSAKIRESELRVFSPPDSLLISFQAFLGGRTLKFIPSLKGSKESISSNSASPPFVNSWYTSLSLELITPNPSRKASNLFSFNSSIFLLSSPCCFLTDSNSSCFFLKSANLALNSDITCRLFPLIFFKFYSSVTSIVRIFSANNKKGSSVSSSRSMKGGVSSKRSIGNMRLPLDMLELSRDWLSSTEESRDLLRSTFFLTLSMFNPSMLSNSSRKSQVADSYLYISLSLLNSWVAFSISISYTLILLVQSSTYYRALSIFSLLSLTSFSSSSNRAFRSDSIFLQARILSSPALMRPIVSVARTSISCIYFLNFSISVSSMFSFFVSSSLAFLFSVTRLTVVSRIATFFCTYFSSRVCSCFDILQSSRSSPILSVSLLLCQSSIYFIWA